MESDVHIHAVAWGLEEDPWGVVDGVVAWDEGIVRKVDQLQDGKEEDGCAEDVVGVVGDVVDVVVLVGQYEWVEEEAVGVRHGDRDGGLDGDGAGGTRDACGAVSFREHGPPARLLPIRSRWTRHPRQNRRHLTCPETMLGTLSFRA